MPTRTPIVRKLALAQFAPFARNARAALSQAGVADLEHAAVFQTQLTARCCGCDARLSPEMVAALFAGAEFPAGRPAEELARLRQGYCLRAACESRFYELAFAAHPAVDWTAIGTEAQADAPDSSAGLTVGRVVVRNTVQAVRSQLTWKLATAVLLLLSLLVWRQWWTGGSIPFFREAKTFTSEGGTSEPMSGDDDSK